MRGVPLIGPYLAGWLSCWPYVFVVLAIVRLRKGTPLSASFGDADWVVMGLGTLYVGAVVGFVFFRDA